MTNKNSLSRMKTPEEIQELRNVHYGKQQKTSSDNSLSQSTPNPKIVNSLGLNIRGSADKLQFGLYTIVEEDKSQLNRSRISETNGKDSLKVNKFGQAFGLSNQSVNNSKKTSCMNFSNKDSSCPNISESLSTSLKTGSLLKNINLKNDFSMNNLEELHLPANHENSDYIVSSIYDPQTSTSDLSSTDARRPKSQSLKSIKGGSMEQVKEKRKSISSQFSQGIKVTDQLMVDLEKEEESRRKSEMAAREESPNRVAQNRLSLRYPDLKAKKSQQSSLKNFFMYDQNEDQKGTGSRRDLGSRSQPPRRFNSNRVNRRLSIPGSVSSQKRNNLGELGRQLRHRAGEKSKDGSNTNLKMTKRRFTMIQDNPMRFDIRFKESVLQNEEVGPDRSNPNTILFKENSFNSFHRIREIEKRITIEW